MIKNNCLYDYVCSFYIITTLAFHDTKEFFIIGQIIFILFTFFDMVKKSKIRLYKNTKKYYFWYILFFSLSALSGLWSLSTKTYDTILISIAQTSIMSICIINYLKDEKKLHNVFRSIIIASILLCIRLIISVPSSAWGDERIGVYIGYGNVGVTYVLAYSSIITFYLGRINNKKLYIFLSLFFIFISSMTGTKKGLLIFLIGLFIMFILETDKPLHFLKNMLIFIFVCMISYYAILNIEPLYNSIGVRFENAIGQINGNTLDKSTRDRMILMSSSWETFKEYPILGIGVDGFRNYELNTIHTYAHNNYLELLADLGIVGGITYYSAIVITFFKSFGRKIKKQKYGIMCCVLVVSLLFGDFSTVSYYNETTQIYLALLIGMVCLLEKKIGSIKGCENNG